jgi:ferrous iron transport protein B
MLVIPLTTCSARLPVYTLIISALFPARLLFGWLPVQGALMVGAYVLSMLLTLVAALVLGRTVVRGRQVPLILELPPYRVPSVLATLKMVRERAGDFLRGAGSTILVCTMVLWALLAFPRSDLPATVHSDAKVPCTAFGSQQRWLREQRWRREQGWRRKQGRRGASLD